LEQIYSRHYVIVPSWVSAFLGKVSNKSALVSSAFCRKNSLQS